MSSAADSPVLTSAPQVLVKESQDQAAVSGNTWPESLAKYDHATYSWRTHQYSLLGGLESFSETWPRWGTMRDGACWALTMPEHLTNGTGSGYWPTPSGTSNHGKNHVVGRLDEWGGSSNMFRGTELQSVRCPSFEEWMMDWPIRWSDAQTPFGMDKFQAWLDSHGTR